MLLITVILLLTITQALASGWRPYKSHKVIYGCESRGDAHSPYLTRYTLIERPDWQICLHIFHRSDGEEHHDHPWDFFTFILWRGYNEHTPAGVQRIWPLTGHYRPASHQHRVALLNNDRRAVTLVWMGRRYRNWGFFTAGGWVNWITYFKERGC